MQRILRSLPVLLLAGLAACQGESGPRFATSASLQDLMVSIVDPAADALWESVGSVSTAAGVEERAPRTDDDWQALRRQAVTLVESANLLQIRGRPVVASGGQVEDAHVPGVLPAAGIAQAIAAQRQVFDGEAQRFREVADKALRAIDAKSVPGLLDAGGQLQEACESCHRKFWYPNARQPG